MTGFWTPFFASIAGFFLAWVRALYASMPGQFQSMVTLSWKPIKLELSSYDQLTSDVIRSGSDIDFVLKDQLVLVRRFRLRLVAASELNKAVMLEAERIMPVALRQLYVAYRVERRADKEYVEVILVASRRSKVDQLLGHARKLGCIVRSVAIQHGDQEVLLSLRETTSLSRWRFLLAAGLGMTLIFLISLPPSFYLAQLSAATEETDKAIRAARKDTARIAGLQQRVDALKSMTDAVNEAKTEGQILELMHVLTAISPDDVTIEELRLNGRRLYLSGRARTPEDWVLQLHKHGAFSDVRLTSVLDAAQENSRRFEVQMSVLWPQERPAP